MARIVIPSCSPFGQSGPVQDAKPHSLAYQELAHGIVKLNQQIAAKLAAFDASVAALEALRGSGLSARQFQLAEKSVLASKLPSEIRRLQKQAHDLQRELGSHL